MNNYMEKIAMRNPEKNLSTEVLEGEGIVLVDEENDKIHFINSSGLIFFEEIKNDAVKNVFERYRKRVIETYSFNDEKVIKKSFNDFLDLLIQNQLIILLD